MTSGDSDPPVASCSLSSYPDARKQKGLPYRDAIPVPRALEMMAENLGTAIDPDCFAALKAGIEDFSLYLTPEQPLARAS